MSSDIRNEVSNLIKSFNDKEVVIDDFINMFIIIYNSDNNNENTTDIEDVPKGVLVQTGAKLLPFFSLNVPKEIR